MSNGDTIGSASEAQTAYQSGVNPTDWSWIGDMVNSGIMTQAMIQKMIADQSAHPCGLAAFMRALLGGIIQDQLDLQWAEARTKSEFLPDVIEESIERRGNMPPGSTLSGGKRLGEFAIETLSPSLLIPGPVLVFQALTLGPGLATLAQFDFVENHMPSGQDILNGTWQHSMSNTGSEVSPGVYLYPNAAHPNARYRGYKVRQLIERWIEYQRDNVTSTDLANARTRLIALVGTWQGSGELGIWDHENDPVLAGSTLGNILFMEEECIRIEAESRAICEGLVEGEAGRGWAELAADVEEMERIQRRNDWAVVGGLVLGAFVIMQAPK